MRRARVVGSGIAVAVLAAGTVIATQLGTAAAPGGDPAPVRSAQRPIAWHACTTGDGDELGHALDVAGVRCGEVTVPVDYANPQGRTITVAVARARATDPARRRGVLFLDPGGPGVPAMDQLLGATQIPQLAARYDLIGMDPRFVGRSSPLTCTWTTDTFLRSAGPDRRSFEQSVALARSLAAGCAPGEQALLPHASTRNTARDLDVVRAALGERTISYVGVSYGTYLGAVYLQLFPGRVDRFVLDSAVDPAAYGPGVLRGTAGPALAALRRWASWAADRDGSYHLGSTAAEVLATVGRIDAAAARRPLPVGGYPVDAHVLPYLLFVGLSSDAEEAYAALAADVRTLADVARGAAAEPSDGLRTLLTGLFTGAGAATDRQGTPVLCADRAVPRDPEAYYRDIRAHRAEEPLFGPLARNITPCAFWPVPPAEAPTAVANGVPVLVVGAAGDPVAPYPGQLAMHRALAGSRMVTSTGAYRHGVYLTGNACVDAAVDAYLLDGKLPAADMTCS